MGSDKTRISYDEKQQYRGVVMQQGRVTLDADWNEAQQITSEEMRREALDFVGPTGTPDDGYKISVPSAGLDAYDFQISQGTMYVGGLRVALNASFSERKIGGIITYQHQPDWLKPAAPVPATPSHEFIYLALNEQEISAVEDSALREVALGGPDTAQRTRLIQRIRRTSIKGLSCGAALAEQIKVWRSIGLEFDPQTMRLVSQSTLKVNFEDASTPPDPCEPAAHGGYLGAENQLIRVRITDNNKLVWGFDNASFIYRIDEVGADNQTLKLKSRPVDDFHRPRAGQVVEALGAMTQLSNGEYVADTVGHLSTLQSAYNPDAGTVTLADALPAAYQMPKNTPRLFLRVWEQELKFAPGTPVTLGETGVQVILKVPAGKKFHVGDFWTFAVRPSTSTAVYPQRYLAAFQPPEGPRMWVCPLAVIEWNNKHQAVIADCREHFDNLVELTRRQRVGGCCTIVLKPEDVKGRGGGLQSFLDEQIQGVTTTVCLMPGVYELTEPLRLHRQHSNLTLEGCRRGVILQAARGAEAKFFDGLMVLDRTANLTLKGLQLMLPRVPLVASGGTFAGLQDEQLREFEKVFGAEVAVSIGIRTIHSSRLKIEDCRFDFSPQAAGRKTVNTFAVGIFAGGQCTGLRVRRNSFIKDAPSANQQNQKDLALGYVLAPSLQFDSTTQGLTNAELRAQGETRQAATANTPTAHLLSSLLHDAAFQENEFSGLTLATLIWSETGAVEIRGNNAHDCYAGFWLLSERWLNARSITSLLAFENEMSQAAVRVTDEAKQTQPTDVVLAMQGMLHLLFDTRLLFASLGTILFPLPAGFEHAEEDKVVQVAPSVIPATQSAPSIGVLSDASKSSFNDAPLKQFGMELPEILQSKETPPSKASDFVESDEASALKPLLTDVDAIINSFAALAVPQPAFQFSLDFSHNIVEALAQDGTSGNALLIWDTDQRSDSMLTMNANRLRNNSLNLPTAAILMLDRLTCNGNLVLNEQVFIQKFFLSLLLIPGAPQGDGKNPDTGGQRIVGSLVAITGNVFKGWPLLPNRFPTAIVPSPMNTWNFMNSQSW